MSLHQDCTTLNTWTEKPGIIYGSMPRDELHTVMSARGMLGPEEEELKRSSDSINLIFKYFIWGAMGYF